MTLAVQKNSSDKPKNILELFKSIGDEVMISHEVITQITDIRKDAVKRTIETLQDKGILRLTQIVEVNHRGQRVTNYYLNKRDSLVAIAQIKPEVTADLVDRWQELENQQTTQTPLSRMAILEMAIESEKENEVLRIENAHKDEIIEEQQPKVLRHDLLMTCKDGVTGTVCAKMLKLPFGNVGLYKHFRSWGWMFARTTEATQMAIDSGYVKMVAQTPYTKSTGEQVATASPRIMPKAFKLIIKKLKKDGALSEGHEMEAVA